IQPLWDVCHYGWPDDLNIWSPAFVTRFAHFAAATAAIEAIRDVDPRAQFIAVDPIINVVPNVPEERGPAERARLAQYQAWDMLVGDVLPELGGKPEYLDIVGVNFYSHNQWYLDGPTIRQGEALYRPLREM